MCKVVLAVKSSPLALFDIFFFLVQVICTVFF